MNRERIWQKATRTIRDNSRLRTVVSQASQKLKEVTRDSASLTDLSNRIRLLIRMVRAHLTGDFTAFSSRTILLSTFALLYFIIPTDAIPDFIPALGFSDDISILYFIWKQIEGDVSKFSQWEQAD